MNYRMQIRFRIQGEPYEDWGEEFKTEDYKNDIAELLDEIVTYVHEEIGEELENAKELEDESDE